MNHLKIIQPGIYIIEKEKIEENSHLPIEIVQNENVCIAIPFLLGGDGEGTYNQINWTNMYLTKQLGSLINPNIQDEIVKKSYQEIEQDLPKDLQDILKLTKNPEKYNWLEEYAKPLETKLYDIKRGIDKITYELVNIRRDTKQIKQALGVQGISIIDDSSSQINMMRKLTEEEYEEEEKQVYHQDVNKNILQTRLIVGQVNGGQ